jgi:D-sedoheptulose 7-phosphate isomerase
MGSAGLKQQAFIREYFSGSIAAKLAAMQSLGPALEEAAMAVAASIAKGGKWLIFGNGGSAADAQHLAAEMSGRLYKMERRGIPALALTTDSSALSAISNDYGYAEVFARQVEALAKKGDVVLGISTSGNSENVLKAVAKAKKLGCATIAFSGGKGGGKLAKAAGLCLSVASEKGFHVQECHIAMGHALCFMVEKELKRRRFL